jgi:threonylcarbamoyladenosine tRNA methylthiotransferase MtaB
LRIADVVPNEIRQRRTLELRLLSEKKKRSFYEKFNDTEQLVLWESAEDEGVMYGFTENYLKVSKAWQAADVNSISNVQLGSLSGELVYKVV